MLNRLKTFRSPIVSLLLIAATAVLIAAASVKTEAPPDGSQSTSYRVSPSDVTSSLGDPAATPGLANEFLLDKIGMRTPSGYVGTRRLKLIRQTYEPGGSHDPHQHADAEQAYYVVSGTGKARIDTTWYEMTAGTVFYIPPNTEHQVINNGEVPLVNILIDIVLDSE